MSQIYIRDRQYGVAVRFPEIDRQNPEAIGNLVLTSSTGALIPLSQVANISLQTGESTITHERNQRHLTVKLNYRDLSSLLAEGQQKVATDVKFDSEKYRVEWGGQFENQQRAQSRLVLILFVMLGLMLVLIYAEFALTRHALLILGIVPFATLGGLIALHVTGLTLNVASAVGFIALFGVAVEDAIIMVSNLNRLRDTGAPLYRAVLTGAGERFRPILMTASVATVGMLPAAMATGIGSDVQRNLGTVIVGGLITTTLLNLFLLPTLYFIVERRAARSAARRAALEGRSTTDVPPIGEPA